MSAFSTVLVSGKKVSMPVEAGTSLSLSSISFDTKQKKKGIVEVRAKPANSTLKDGYVIGVVSSEAKKNTVDLSISFDESNSPVELWIVGDGKVNVVGSKQMAVAVKPSKKAKTEKAAKADTEVSDKVVIGKKIVASKVEATKVVEETKPVAVVSSTEEVTKKDNQSYKKRKAAALEEADQKETDEPKQINMRKLWKVKPQNEEGVLVEKVKSVFRLKNLKCTDYVIGNGAIPSAGATVKITYTGLLPDGTVFDSRMKRLSPFVFRKGVNQVVKGLDLGMEGMKVGGSREISIPPELGYGEEGMGNIPGNQTLIFRVTLLA